MKPSDAIKMRDNAKDEIRAIIERHGFTNAKIFGSVAKGTDKEGSDLDIFVNKGLRKVSTLDLAELELEISAVLGVPVQVVTVESTYGDRWAKSYSEAISL